MGRLSTRSAAIVLTAMCLGAACAAGDPTPPPPHPGDCTEEVVRLPVKLLILYESGYYEYDGDWGYRVGYDLSEIPDKTITNAYFHSKTFY